MKKEPSSPKNVEDVYPLSPMQEGMLFHSLYAPGSGVYITQLACTLEGLHVAPFERAWQTVVDRHPILRTAFVWKNTPRLMQVVGRRVGVPIEHQDWRGLTAAEQAGQWDEHLQLDRRRDFDFSKAPLLRLSLMRTGEETWRFLWTCHHILLDGWCVSLVLREVFTLYQTFRPTLHEEREAAEAGLGHPRPYRSYIGWLQKQDRAAAEAFWRGALAGFTVPPPLEAGGAPEGGGEGYGRERLYLDAGATAAAELMARRHNLTFNTLALGSWALLLGRYTGAPEALFGTVVSGRPPELPGAEEIVGPFLNTLPLRISLAPDPSVLSWLKSLQSLQVEMRQYEHTPLADLQKWSEVPAGQQLFTSVLAFENYPRAESTLGRIPGLAVRDVWSEEQTNFPLSIAFSLHGGRLMVNVFYEHAAYEQTAIIRLLGHVAALLTGMAAGPDLRLGELSPLSAAERHQVEAEWNDTRTGRGGATVHELFEAQAGRTPQAVALVDGERRLTYLELDTRANRLARRLRDLGAGPETLVALCLERSSELVEAILAAWKAGAAYLPLDPSLPSERLAFQLADSGAQLLVTDAASIAGLPEPSVRVLFVEEMDAAETSEERLDSGARPENLAYLIYTSGTTGRPKAVMVEHAQLTNVLLACGERFGFAAGDGMLHLASFSFDISLFELFIPLLAGGRSILVRRDEILDVPRLAARFADVAAVHGVPSLLRQAVDHLRGLDADGNRRGPALIFTGGDSVPADLLTGLREVFPAARIAVLYGPTEGTIVCSAYPVPAGRIPARAVIGRPLANVELRVVDSGLATAPVGVAGELCLGGAGVARGYLGREELTRERFVLVAGRRFYRTGDRARWLPDGNLEFLGRIDDQVKIHGFRVELGEIEAVLREHPAVADAVVLAPAEDGGGRRLAAWVVPASDSAPAVADLRAHLGRKLPAYMVPAAFHLLSALPLTPHGKVDRRALAAGTGGAARLAAARDFTAPRTAAEESLAAIWAEMLKAGPVGIHDNFFELGGDSILSIQIVARANRAGIRLTPRDLFEHPTIAQLAEIAELASAAGEGPARRAEQGPVTGPVPLLPVQRRFFARNPPEPHHFNLPLLLTVSPELDPGLLARAVRQIAIHHDALRLRFRRGENGWEQAIAGLEALPRLASLDLSSLPEQRRAAALESAAALLQAGLDLERGLLLRAAFFRLAPGEPGRLLLAVHHLAVDGVSWRILIEDLETACRQLGAGEPVRLPAKTTSFKEWAERLGERSQSASAAERSVRIAPLPVDFARRAGSGFNRAATARTLASALDEEETRALLTEAPAAYRTRINDVLLAALVLACARWTGESALLVDLEGHGREEEAFPGVDLSRTVGWLTVVNPVLLDAPDAPDADGAGTLLKRVKEQLRAAPDTAPGGLPEPEIGFNYLGQLDRGLPVSSLFGLAPEPAGPAASRRGVRAHLLEVNASVTAGRLRTNWTYSSEAHRPETIERLAAEYQKALRSIIAHCLSPRTGGATPSDFPLARLTQPSLDRLLGAGPRARRIEDIYALSPLQQGMLFHALYAPAAGAYVVQRSFELAGELDIAAFRRAWQQLTDRHAVLRTSFAWQDLDRPLQMVHGGVAVPVAMEDWSGLPEDERGRRVADWLEADRRRDFDLHSPPLLRLALLRTAPGRHRLVWSCHHLLLDGWCMALLFDEVLGLYAACAAGREIRLPSTRPYRDYIAWLERQDLAAAEAFWRQTLAGFTSSTELPLAHDPGGSHEEPGRRRKEKALVPAEVVAALQELGRRNQLTLNTLIEAAWAALLSRYAQGEKDILFGITVSGRPAELVGVESMIGLFINTLPRRIEVSFPEPLLPWLARLQRQHLDLRQHEYTPLSEIQRWSAVPRGPLFESIFSLENYPVDGEALKRHRIGFDVLDPAGSEDTDYPVDLAVMLGRELLVILAYDSARLEPAAAGRLLHHFGVVLASLAGLPSLAAEPERRVGDLDILSPGERRQLVVDWNETALAFPQDLCLHELFARQAAATPAAPALLTPEEDLTFGELNRRANQLAHSLRALGVGPETVVGLCVERSVELAVGLLGILKAGGAYLPLDPSYPPARLSYMLEDARLSLLLTQERLLPALGLASGLRALCLDTAWPVIAGESPEEPPPLATARNLAYAIYTSGSTGQPKSALVEHRALVNFTLEMVRQLGLVPADRVLQFASPAFDVLVEELFPVWLAGGSVVLPQEDLLLSVHGLRRVIVDRGVTGLELPAAYWQEWVHDLAQDGGPPPSLRFVIVGSEKPGAARLETWQGFGVPLIYVFGLTETAVTSSLYKLPPGAGAEDLDLPIGRPVANTALYLLDRELQPVPRGVAGELYIGGAGVGRGYLHRPALTAQRFLPDLFAAEAGARLYRTGDLARYRADGNLELLGRIDLQVKIRGFRVELGEIEAALRQHPGVKDAAVDARPAAAGGRRLIAYVVPLDDAMPPPGDLRAHLERRLPEHMLPAVFVALAALPLTPNGKVDRRALPEPDAARRGTEDSFIAPRTPAEEALAGIWAEVLGVARVGVEDNYFELGGDSILSLQVTSKARRAGLFVTPRDLFEHPTVARLAAVARTAEESTAEQGEVTGPVPLTPIQHWFLAQDPADPHHFNLPLLLELRAVVPAPVLELVLVSLLAHHDALRLRFARSEAGWRQFSIPPGGPAPFSIVDLSALAAPRQDAALAEAGAALQASLDLARGPLLRAALFSYGAERPQNLLLIGHHLVLDTVSWRIFAEDLAHGLRQAAAGEGLDLPRKTTAFQRWAERLTDTARSPAFTAEMDWWAAETRSRVAPLPVDLDGGNNTRQTARTLSVALDRDETQALLQEVPRVSRAQLQEVLVTALGLALAGWSGERLLLIDLEGHGREDLFADLDLSRTVGWFASIYPVLIDLRATDSSGSALKAVKEGLRATPGRGIGYGLLRYLGTEEAARRLASLPPPEVLFNYVGQIGQGLPADLPFALGRGPIGRAQSPRARRAHLLEINADIRDGLLRMSWTYSSDLHRRTTVEALSAGMAAALRALIAACRAGEASGAVPSDFPLAARAGLTQAQLDLLSAGRPFLSDVYPLSPLQRGMLFDLLYQPQAGLYRGQLVCELHGDLDIEIFRAAWQKVVDRHAALRTTFHWGELAEPLQAVEQRAPLPLTVEDWTGLSEAAQRDRLALAAGAGSDFSAAQLPLMHLLLARKRDGVHQLVWSFLQILMDGWSLPLIFQEGLDNYAALHRGEEPQAGPVRDFRDYIDWLGRQDRSRDEAFWRRALAGFTAPTPLPAADRPWSGSAEDGGEYARSSLRLDAALTAELRSLARRHQLTQNTLVQGAWALLLARSSGEREVTFGVVAAGRPAEIDGVESMVGLFINTLPARIAVPPGEPVASWLRGLQDQAAELREHEHTTLSEMQRWSGVPAGQPLFETILVFENYPVAESLREARGGIAVRELRTSEKAAFPLSLAAHPGGHLALIAAYYRQVYDDATVVRLVRQLASLLAGMAAEPEARLSALPLLSTAERHQLTREWNDTAARPSEGLFLAGWNRQVALRPDAVAIRSQGANISYGELDRRANRLAHQLSRLGAGPEVPIGVCLERSPEAVAAILAIWKAGAAYVPLDPSYPAERLSFMLEETGAPLLITDHPAAERLPGSGGAASPRRVYMDGDAGDTSASAAESAAAPAGDPAASDLAYLIFTSGSTGRPKAVQVEHGSLANTLLGNLGRFGPGPAGSIPSIASFSFDISLFECFSPLLSGGTSVLLTRQEILDPEALLDVLGRVTALHAVPSLMRQLVSLVETRGLASPGYGNLRQLFVGGDYVALDLLERMRRSFPSARITVLYGPTEATIICAAYDLSRTAGPERSLIGRPLANAGIRLLDPDGNESPIGVPGEICVTGPGVARGYLGRPELTAERFVALEAGRAYRTGDLARRLPDGTLEFLGRLDEQVKIRGFRIEPGEIEAVLSGHPGVREAVVQARGGSGDKPAGELRLVAWLVPAEEPGPAPAELRAWLGDRLPDYMVPSFFVPLAVLPRLPTGKVDRRALPSPEADLRPGDTETAAPRNATEETLAAIWRQVLGIERVGIHDNFFELGGDSILSIQIVARAQQAGIRLTPRQIFELRTVAELAAAAGTAPVAQAEQGLVVGAVPLTPIQQRFLEQAQPEPQHANLSLLLEPRFAAGAGISAGLLDRAVRSLFAHHDALRLRFERDGAVWRQWSAGAEGVASLVRIDLSALADGERRAALHGALAQAQASLDLAEGPLARAVLFAMGEGEPARLLFAVHHLVVDGVSWRILLDDLQSAVEQGSRGEEIRLPAKTTSFKSWAERLAEHAQSAEIMGEMAYWLSEERRRYAPLPVELAAGENTVASGRSVAVSLEPEETTALLHAAPEAYRTEINDLLLTALARTLARWTGRAVSLVELEGHGREDLFPDVDLSRTVGWLTSFYPVLLDPGDEAAGPGAAIQAVKEQLRGIPGRGIGYGLLRGSGSEAATALHQLPAPEVSFNYLGQLDQVIASAAAFVPAREPAGPPQSPRARREHLLAVGAQVLGGRLRIDWSYSENRHRRETIEELAQAFAADLRALIAHCIDPAAGAYTPADFPLAVLRPEELGRLLAGLSSEQPVIPRHRVIEDIYPLTPMQQGMLFHTLYSPGSEEYFEQLSPVLYGDLDAVAFRRAWQQVVDRHPVLRTAVVWQGLDQAFQVVCSRVELPWHEEDWRGLPEAEQKSRLEAYLREDRRQGFELARAPLLRLGLIRLADAAWQVVWDHHHLLLDAWCRPLVFQEVLTFYEACRLGRAADLPRPRPYRDYIAWLRRQDLAATEAFWRRNLQGFTEPTSFGVDRASAEGAAAGQPWDRRTFRLSLAATQDLEAASRRYQVTLSTLMQAALALLLARYSGSGDVVFGTVVSGRPPGLPGVESMIGMFINTLPVRVAVPAGEETGARSWLAELQAQQLELRQYEHTPLVEAQRWSGLPPGSRLFESMFVFLNSRRDESVLAGSSLRIGEMQVAERADFPLTVIGDLRRELLIELQYDLRRFEPVAIVRMLSHLATLLAGLARGGDAPLTTLPLLGEPERHQLLVEWHDTATPVPGEATIHGLFEAQAARTPGAVALIAGESRITFRDLDAQAGRLARRLRALGIGAEDRVGLCVTRSLAMAVGILGALKAGAAYVPIDPAYPAERLAFLLSDSAVSALLTEEKLVGVLPAIEAPRILIDDARESASTAAAAVATAATAAGESLAGNAAYVIYTSGSTGTPKGVVVAHAELVNYTLEMIRQLRLGSDDRILQFASLGFDVVVEELFPAWLAGAAVVLHERDLLLSVRELEEVIDTHGVTGVELPAAYWQEWVHELEESGRPAPRSLRWVIVGSEKPAPDRVRAWHRLGVPLIYVFGLTETTVTSTLHRLPAGEVEPGAWELPIGRPVANTRLYLLDRTGRPTPARVPAELYIGGGVLARAYHDRPDLTAERFVPDPFSSLPGQRLYRSGDQARYRWNGELDFLGRLDGQVKVRGFRVELGEVEAAILALGKSFGVREAAVLAGASSAGGNRLLAYVVPERDRDVSAASLRDELRQRLPEHMVPAAFTFLPELPLTANGKVDRRALAQLAPETPQGLRKEHIAPRSPLEEKLAEIWAEVLRVERVGVEDNFFELGGDSILSIQVTSRAHRAGIRLTPRQLFEHPTVAELARVAGSAAVVESEQGPVTGPVPLTPIQHWFFAAQTEDAHHFNLPVLLELQAAWKPPQIARALAALLTHHDALRLRFEHGEEGWRQWTAEPEPSVPFVPFVAANLSALSGRARVAALEQAGAELQGSLDLSRGPLLRAALFDLGEDGRRLLLVCHHLVVDTISLQLFAEDLAATCELLSRGEAPSLPLKTTSFQRWAEHLAEHARSAEIAAEADHWLADRRAEVFPLPLDHPQGVNTEASARTLSVLLDEEETQALLQEVPRSYRTQINDILLTALAQGFAGWTGDPLLLVDFEGHGREEELFTGVDLARTVGWFASLYPVLLDLSASSEPGPALKAVKEQLRSVPGRGLGYGLLRYLRGDELTERLRSRRPAEVLFNYLGQIDQGEARALPLALAREPIGPSQSRRARRTHLLEVNAEISRRRLRVSWGYSENLHRRSTIERLAEDFLAALRALISHCRSPEAGGYTPSDFPLVDLDQQQLDRLLLGQQREIEDLYPLSPLQQGMLFHALFAPEAGVYLGQLSCELLGRMDVELFQSAWQRVVDRHPALRTSFRWQELEAPLQIVHPAAKIAWEHQDWRGLSDAEQSGRLAEYLAEDRRRGFDLTRAPLMHLLLARTGEDSRRLVWSFHQILIDGWSLPLVFREGFALYEAALAGREAPLPPSLPYRTYISWLSRQNRQATESYWRGVLEGFTAPTPLAVDRGPEAPGEKRAYRERFLRLSSAATAALQGAVRRHQLTLNTLVQAAWGLLLSRYSGEDDVVFGTTVSGRPAELPGIEAMVGLFINTLPVRISLPAGSVVLPWLRTVQDRQAELRQYEHTALSDIQRWSRVPAGRPLFDSILVVENYPVEEALKEQGGSLRVVGSQTAEKSNFPLTAVAMPGRELMISVAYYRERFDDTTIDRLLAHLGLLLESLLPEPTRALRDVPMLSAEERQQLSEWSGTHSRRDVAPCVHEALAAWARRDPGATALLCGGEALTYGEINSSANRLAHHLRELGTRPEMPVAVCLERSPDLVVAALAIFKAGGVYVPLDPTYPRERLAFMLEDAAAPLLITQGRLVDALPSPLPQGARVLRLDAESERIASRSQADPVWEIGRSDLAYMIYTSGSTGRPKAVCVEHGNLADVIRSSGERFRFTPADRMLHMASFSFDISLFELFVPLTSGAAVALLSRQEIVNLGELAKAAEAATVIHAVPSLMRQIAGFIRAGGRDCPHLRQVFVGGDAVPPDLLAELGLAFPRAIVTVLYGPTEGTIICAGHTVTPGDPPAGSVLGRPFDGAHLQLFDRHGRPVPIGVPGELWIGGTGVARGYLNREELTAEKFVRRDGRRFYRSGDLARYQPDGTLEFLGRIDQQVKVRGFRIELGEVEAALSRHPAVREVVALARLDAADSASGGGDRRLVAYIVPLGEPAPSTSELHRFAQESLPDPMVPSAFVVLEALPLLPNGKVDRAALPAPGDARPELEKAYLAPRNEVEEQLAAIWQQVLGIKQVGVDDNFFELGGDSLLSIQIVAKANQLGLRLTPRQLFEHQTIARLATVVGSAPEIRAEQGLVEGPVPLTPIQQRFFADNAGAPHHGNQSLLLEVRERLDSGLLEAALQRLPLHHDALRLRYRETASGWEQRSPREDETLRLGRVDLSGLPAEVRRKALEAAAESVQASLDLVLGPRMRVVHFALGSGHTDRLLVVIHHLLVDGVSWPILLEDLVTAYRQLGAGEPVVLPAKTTSFKEWADRLVQHARSGALDPELSYWLAEARTEVCRLPVDFPGGANTTASTATFAVDLEEEETRALLQDVPKAYQTQINEALLTAVAQAFAEWSGQGLCLVDLEGHGREELFEDLDISRTVGWFTALYPVLLDVRSAPDVASALKGVKEQLRSIPLRGVGYGLLLYLHGDAEVRERLRRLTPAEVSFNFMGQLDQGVASSSPFALARESMGAPQSPAARRTHLIEVDGRVLGGRLRLEWSFSRNVHRSETVERLAQRFVKALRTLIAHCLSPEAGGYTPSDFPLMGFSQDELDELVADEDDF